MIKSIVFVALVLSNAYALIALTKAKHEIRYQQSNHDQTVKELSGSWLNKQNIIDRQVRFIKELADNCGDIKVKRGLEEDDLKAWH